MESRQTLVFMVSVGAALWCSEHAVGICRQAGISGWDLMGFDEIE